MIFKNMIEEFVAEHSVTEDFAWNKNPDARMELTRMIWEHEKSWLYEQVFESDDRVKELIETRLKLSGFPEQISDEVFGRMLLDMICNASTDSLDDFMSDMELMYCGEESDEQFNDDNHERYLDVSATARRMKG